MTERVISRADWTCGGGGGGDVIVQGRFVSTADQVEMFKRVQV